jgi:hypothetical protein
MDEYESPVYKKVENFPDAPAYDFPKGVNPLDINTHFLTPNQMWDLGIRRKS